MNEIIKELAFLVSGTSLRCAQFPAHDNMAELLEGLKKGGFVSGDTDIVYFRVLFGVPIHKNHTPFKPVRWMKNAQLLRYFVYSIFPRETIGVQCIFIVARLFANKYGENIMLPNADNDRLKQSADFEALKGLLNKFKGGVSSNGQTV